MFRTFHAALVLLTVMCSIPRLDAQVLYGSIVGTVTDQAGASVPGAKVRITSRGTTQAREAETDSAGTYTFPSLAPDMYDVVVTKQGQVFTGLLVADTPTLVRLRGQPGAEETILRGDIEEVRPNHQSLMPEGFEQALTLQDVAHVLEFLQHPVLLPVK